jgi:hypothetical protein
MEIMILLTGLKNSPKLSYMRHNTAIPWIFTSFAAIALAASATAEVTISTIQTIDGESYTNAKVLKVESDGVIVKHSKGIAKIPFYELDDATRSAVGYAGEVEPPIRHSAPPETGLLPDIDGHAVESSDLDLEADPAVTEDEEKDAAAMQSEVRGSPERPASRLPFAQRSESFVSQIRSELVRLVRRQSTVRSPSAPEPLAHVQSELPISLRILPMTAATVGRATYFSQEGQ